MNANERRLAIWHTLCKRRQATIAYLAAEFSVSPRTIRYDVDILSLSYPIITKRGKNGCIQLAEDYQPSKQVVSPAQMALLLRMLSSMDGEDALILRTLITALSEVRHS